MDLDIGMELGRMGITLAIMIFASVSDAKKMEVSDIPWIIGIGAGVILLIVEVLTSGAYIEMVWIPFMLGLAYLMGFFGLFGGADVKSVFAIALLNPKMSSLSLVDGLFPVALSVLINCTIILLVLYPFMRKMEEIPFLPIMTAALVVSYLVTDPLSYLFTYLLH